MRKIIAIRTNIEKSDKILKIKNIFDQFFGGANIYEVPCGNVFFDSFDNIEVCMYFSGKISLCGLGEYKKTFENSVDFGDFVEKYLENKK